MARIRTIKPEFWDSEDVGALSPLGRLIFIWLMSHADDEGRLKASPAHVARKNGITLKTVHRQLTMMAGRGMVACYRDSAGADLMAVLNFRKHQRVDKPQPSQLEAPGGAQTELELEAFQERSKSVRASRASPPVHSVPSPLPSGGFGGEPPTERFEELLEGVTGLLKRPASTLERSVVLGWADLERNHEPVPVSEILHVADVKLRQRTPEGTLPRNLKWCDQAVRTLARGPYSGRPVAAGEMVGAGRLDPADLRTEAARLRARGGEA